MVPLPRKNLISQLCVVLLLVLPVLADDFTVESALGYKPNRAVGVVGFIVYFVTSVLLFWKLVRNQDWWGLCLPLGGFAEATGFMLRVFINEPHLSTNQGYFLSMYLLIVLPPAAFLAFNYIVYGRLMRICAGPGREHSCIRPKLVGIMFIISDIVTFLIQVFGGSLTGQQQTATIGQDIFLGGIAAQAASYVFYLGLVVSSQRSLRHIIVYERLDLRDTWYGVFKLLYISSVFILIRSIYRVTESALGFNGYLWTHEWSFLVFDSIPLAIGISLYIRRWPGNYIPKKRLDNPYIHQLDRLPPTLPQSLLEDSQPLSNT